MSVAQKPLKAFIVWLPMKLLAIWSALVKTWSSDLRRLALKYERAVWEFTSSQANQVYWASGFPSVRVRFVSGLSPAQKWLRHFQKYCRVLAKVILCLVCCQQNQGLHSGSLPRSALSADPKWRRKGSEDRPSLSSKPHREKVLNCSAYAFICPARRYLFRIICVGLSLLSFIQFNWFRFLLSPRWYYRDILTNQEDSF